MHKHVRYTDEQRCTRCFGRGTILRPTGEPATVSRDHGYYRQYRYRRETCPTCGGSGKR